MTTSQTVTPSLMAESDPYNATLVERIDFSDELALFRIAYDDGDVPDFLPGQFTTIGLVDEDAETRVASRRGKPRLLRRAYSIASSPNEKRYIEFYIVIVPEGKLTPKLWQLKEGDRLFMDKRMSGHFTLDGVPDGKDLVMISTGTGLAPFISMLKTYRGTGKWRKYVVIHGTRLSADLGYREELEQLAHEDDSVIYLPTCTREPAESNWQGLRGRVHTILEPALFTELTGVPIAPDNAQVFLCGNPAMIDECEANLTQRGFTVHDRKKNPTGNVHLERYW